MDLKAFSGKRKAFVRNVMALALTRRIDLLLIGHVNYAPLGLALKLVQQNMRYGVVVHGTDVWSRLSLLKRRALLQADFITAVSEYTKKQVVSVNGARAERIYLLPNTVEGDSSSAETQNLFLPSGFKLLSVCRFEKSEQYKGVDTVIEALPSTLSIIPDLNYYIVGEGNDLARHRALATELGVSNRVHFLGFVDPATLRAYYQACDLFVMPSAGEGFGIVFLEAMHFGKPVIAANSCAAPEVVIDGVTGLLVEYGNSQHISQSIVRVCHDREFRERLGRAGYERLQQNFTFEHFKKKLTDILIREMPARTSPESDRSQVTTGAQL